MESGEGQIIQKRLGRGVSLTPSLPLETSMARHLDRVATGLVRSGQAHLAIDLGRSDVVTSLGLSCLLQIHKATAKAGGLLVLFGLRPSVLDILQKTQLHTVLKVARDQAEAVELLGAP